MIEGAVKRGCMYGVWRFLQKECGWTSLIYGDSDLFGGGASRRSRDCIASGDPVFSYLNMYWHAWGSYKNDKGYPNTVQNSYGHHAVKCCHGLYRFSEVNVMGKQICYTDEDIYELCRDNIRNYIEAQRLQSGQVIGKEFLSVDISQNDNSDYCTCRECMKVFSVEGSNSGAVVRFANRLSEELNEDYPGLYYQIFAYAGSNAAPLKTKPNEFVHITFCSDMNCSNHVFDGSECNGRSTFNMRNNKTTQHGSRAGARFPTTCTFGSTRLTQNACSSTRRSAICTAISVTSAISESTECFGCANSTVSGYRGCSISFSRSSVEYGHKRGGF